MYICTLYTVPKICTFIHYTAPKIGTFAHNTVPKNVHLYTVPKICSLINFPVPSSQKLQHVVIERHEGGGGEDKMGRASAHLLMKAFLCQAWAEPNPFMMQSPPFYVKLGLSQIFS